MAAIKNFAEVTQRPSVFAMPTFDVQRYNVPERVARFRIAKGGVGQ